MTTTADYPLDVAARGAACMAIYDECLANGCAPKLAEMLALRKPPGESTDRGFFAAFGSLADQFGTDGKARGHAAAQRDLQVRVSAAQRAGANVGRNDVYMPGLANRLGDPASFIPPTGGKAHIRKVLESRGYDASNLDDIRVRDDEPPPPPKKLADSIVKRKVNELIAKDPGLAVKDRRELCEAVIDKHGRKD